MTAPKPVLVVGAGGRLGRALSRATWPVSLKPEFAARTELDALDANALSRALEIRRPRVIVNAAGWTDVDGAERDPDGARRLNRDLPAALADVCARSGARLIHVSTDYVFDGQADRPYVETDVVNPLSVYGRTKLDGESAVLAAAPGSIIIRTAWLVGPDRPDFLTAVLDRADRGEPLAVTDDQFGSPTTTVTLAEALITIAERVARDPAAPGGVYHFAGAGEASWRDLAEAILQAREAAGGPSAPHVAGRPADTAPNRAPRPRRSPLASGALARDYGVTAPPWREAIEGMVGRMMRGGDR